MTQHFRLSDLSLLVCVAFSYLVMAYGQNVTTTKGPGTSTASPPPTTTTASPPPTTTTATPTTSIAWQVSSTNGTCILLTGNFSFSIYYKTADNYTAVGNIPIPENATVTGSCSPFLQTLVLTWENAGSVAGVNNITFLFVKKSVYVNGTASAGGQFSLTAIFGRVTATDPTQFANPAIPGQSYYISANEFGSFTAPLTESYICQSYKSVPADKTGNVYLEMEQVQAQAFHEGPDPQFGEGAVCSKDTYFKILPILAYTFIALIVAAVLGSFLWRNFRRSGYAQV